MGSASGGAVRTNSGRGRWGEARRGAGDLTHNGALLSPRGPAQHKGPESLGSPPGRSGSPQAPQASFFLPFAGGVLRLGSREVSVAASAAAAAAAVLQGTSKDAGVSM